MNDLSDTIEIPYIYRCVVIQFVSTQSLQNVAGTALLKVAFKISGREKMTDILQAAFANGFSWMKTFESQMKVNWNAVKALI